MRVVNELLFAVLLFTRHRSLVTRHKHDHFFSTLTQAIRALYEQDPSFINKS